MARPSVIDRNQLLDAAEALVREGGIASLTIGEVAKAAGVSKGGVQSCFGTKDNLIQAMYERWSLEFDDQVHSLAGDEPGGIQLIAAHIAATRATDGMQADRAAGMMTALLGVDSLRQPTRDWYRARMNLADPQTADGRRARLAFLASEGAFLLRSFGFLAMTEDEWQSIFSDIQTLLAADSTAPAEQTDPC